VANPSYSLLRARVRRRACLRTTMIQLARVWILHRPDTALTRWHRAKLAGARGNKVEKRAMVALARKLLIALWK